MKNTLSKIFASVLIVFVALVSFGALPSPSPAQALTAQPKTVAFYADSLATKEGSGDTTMTLVRGTDTQGRALSGLYGFVVDEGTASQETEIGTVSGTNVTAIVRGVDTYTATTSVAANFKTHARGASVKITTWPSVGILNNELSGFEGIPNPIQYDSQVSTTSITASRNFLATWGLVQDVSFNGAGIVNASTGAKGSVQLATQLQTASSTATGSTGALLVIPSSNATSTYNAATASLRVVVTNNAGQIDTGFLSASAPPTGSITAYASSTAPTGWLTADGSAVSRTTYANLFAVIGTYYGYGDNSTSFNVPDLRTSVPLGSGAKVLVATTSALTGVNTGTDLITLTSPANDWMQTGESIAITGSALPSGITAGTYYVIRVSASTIKLAASLSDSQSGIVVDITATGTGTMTMTKTLTTHAIGYQGGEESHAQTTAEVGPHSHTGSLTTASPGTGSNPYAASSNLGGSYATNSTGGGAAMNVLNPYTVVNYIIKT